VILFCAAVEDEFAPLRARLRSDAIGFAAIGVGPVEAALGASAALATRPSAAILVGTCGAFPSARLPIGRTVCVARSTLSCPDVVAERSYVPPLAQVESKADARLVASLCEAAGLPRVGCVTTPAITRDEASAELFGKGTGMEVEHLEAHAFLRAAERAGVPAACVLGVANVVGPNAHEEWKANASAASEAVAEALLRWLDARQP
jgi:nucleoside phosphorylase